MKSKIFLDPQRKYVNRGAVISDCGKYRYQLWRKWSSDKPMLVFCLLNPSIADAEIDDPTVIRCCTRALSMGYGGIRIVNAFAFRATISDDLYAEADPVGPDNNVHIIRAMDNAGMVICGWGTTGRLLGRDKQVCKLITGMGMKPHAIKVNKDGSPGHPLYLSYKLEPKPWEVR